MLKHLAIVALLALMLTACAAKEQPAAAQYRITQVESYDPELCVSTGYSDGGSNISVKLLLKDAITGEPLQGYTRIMMGNAESGTSAGGNDTRAFVCEEGVSNTEAVIRVFAHGHTPAAVPIMVPAGKQETIEFALAPSCTGAGQSCYDIINISARGSAQRAADMQEYLNRTLNASLGIGYSLQCLECDLGRGGFVKGLGTYDNGTRFAFYHRSGWCSSGGTDCASTDCSATFSGAAPSQAAAACLAK